MTRSPLAEPVAQVTTRRYRAVFGVSSAFNLLTAPWQPGMFKQRVQKLFKLFIE